MSIKSLNGTLFHTPFRKVLRGGVPRASLGPGGLDPPPPEAHPGPELQQALPAPHAQPGPPAYGPGPGPGPFPHPVHPVPGPPGPADRLEPMASWHDLGTVATN